ncbi:MAG: glycosyltransferase family 4 protein [Candidatus Andersenbacteria bacterium]|nr:glycosyltransferase family 4 protein [Candidatus Andersenbacteria bacterium]
MNIGIDASRAFIKKRTGTEEYSYQFIKNLTKIDISSHQIFLYVKSNSEIDFDLPKNFIVKKICYNRLWTQLGLSLEMKKNRIDVLFVPSHTIPIIHPRNTVVTIHGLEFKYYPENYSLKERILLEFNTFIAVKWSSKIIVPSKSTEKDLIRFYKVDENKISVIYHGVFSIKYPVLSIKQQERLTHPHPSQEGNINILFVGRLEKRKNLVNLIKAFELFKKHCTLYVTRYTLTIAGKEGFGFAEIKKAIQKSPYKNDIVLKGYISEEEKRGLYQNASLFILPSFYEGFGLPILEAMSYGVPVICSNISSLAEVAGNTALLVDSHDIQDISNAIEKIICDENLRNEMIKKGFENVKKFSWKKCARETMKEVLSR